MIKIWDYKSKIQIDSFQLQSTEFVNYCKFINDNKEILIFQSDGAKLFDFTTKSIIKNFNLKGFFNDKPSFDLNYFKQLIALGASDGKIIIFDLNDNTNPLINLNLPQNSKIYSVKFSKDGNLLAVGDDFGKVYVFKISGELIFQENISNKISPIWSVDISDDNTKVIGGSALNEVKLWRIYNKEILNFSEINKSQIRSVRFFDNFYLTASLDSSISFNFSKGNFNYFDKVSHNGPIIDCNLSNDKNYFASTGKDKSIKFWESPKFQIISDTIELKLKYPINFELPYILTNYGNSEKIDFKLKIEDLFSKDLINQKIDFKIDFIFENKFLYLKNTDGYFKGKIYDTINYKFNDVELKTYNYSNKLCKVLYSNNNIFPISLKNAIILNSDEYYPEYTDGMIEIKNYCFKDAKQEITFTDRNEIHYYFFENQHYFKLLTSDETYYNYAIYNNLGEIILNNNFNIKEINNQISIDNNLLPIGYYFFVISNNYSSITKKFVVIK